MEMIEKLLLQVVDVDCYQELTGGQLSVICLKTAISKILGYTLVVFSALVKVPQLIKIVSHRDAYGISLSSISLDLHAVCTNALYCFHKKYPFSAWGDSFFMAIQAFLILYAFLFYTRGSRVALTFAVLYSLLICILISNSIPNYLLGILQSSIIPTVLVAKMWTNYSNKNTGRSSFIMWVLLCFGSIVRVFTSIMETGDFLVILTFVLSSTLNGFICLQFLYYWQSTNVWIESGTKKKKT